jgi:hypothetical protein
MKDLALAGGDPFEGAGHVLAPFEGVRRTNNDFRRRAEIVERCGDLASFEPLSGMTTSKSTSL